MLICATLGSGVAAAGDASGPTEPVDQLVSVGGSRLHVRCLGAGATTVVLIAGFGDGGDNWDLVESALIPTARVCRYARFGSGTSDPPPSTQTFSSQAEDLRSLLQTIGQPGPYVMVGHSIGGAEAVMFASMFPADVTGLVLVDATPATWLEAICSVGDDGSEAARSFLDVCATLSNPAQNREWLDQAAAFAEIAAIESLGDLPMVVITAADHPTGLDRNADAELNAVWEAGQQYWVSLSSAAQFVSVENVGHHIHLEEPDVVVELIRKLVP